ncbi:MAG: DUF1013 domain-containing protein [Alphaproteobacteria bacterium]|nr:DUF1013 domain-containing protein [Alphaproteobacteria bacterium]MBL0718110.1 DUF1013 domain-containing protein [Alphaproteobacteria bacterium]
MILPLMPNATAVWLIDNTTLTFKQIADFCGKNELEINALSNDERRRIQGLNPITNGQLTKSEIDRCQDDGNAKLTISSTGEMFQEVESNRKKVRKYIPIATRQNRLNGIYWVIKNYPHLKNTTIAKLLSSTAKTIGSIRDKSHKNFTQLIPQNPIVLGLCKEADLKRVLEKNKKSEGLQNDTDKSKEDANSASKMYEALNSSSNE